VRYLSNGAEWLKLALSLLEDGAKDERRLAIHRALYYQACCMALLAAMFGASAPLRWGAEEGGRREGSVMNMPPCLSVLVREISAVGWCASQCSSSRS